MSPENPNEQPKFAVDPNSGVVMTEEELKEMRENSDRNNP